jgi:hypothetical protein
MKQIFLVALSAFLVMSSISRAAALDNETIDLVISGGHESDPRDHGRPVVLIGHALGVTPEIFREAFSRVRPAPAGERPTPERERQNKTVLLEALSRHGITNDQLDTVSNFYRYQPGRDRLWPTKNARAVAVLNDGKITSVKIIDPGAGYSSTPTITVPNHPDLVLTPTLSFGRDLKVNGSIARIEAKPKPSLKN